MSDNMMIAYVPLTDELIDVMVSAGVMQEANRGSKDACGAALIDYLWHLHNELSNLVLEQDDAAEIMSDVDRLLRYSKTRGSA